MVAGVDLERNTIGRASLLAELLHDDYQVEIVAPGFSPDGPHLWAPIRDSAVRVRPFPGRKTLEHMEIMERVARSLRAEAILVSKPRLPSLGLAMLAKEASGVPVIVDVDDLDLAFFGEPGPVDLRTLHARRDEKAFDRVLGGLWTAACEPMIVHGDAVTVSGAPLHDRYGGTVRDERRFDPAAVDRDGPRASSWASTPRNGPFSSSALRSPTRGFPRCWRRYGNSETRATSSWSSARRGESLALGCGVRLMSPCGSCPTSPSRGCRRH